MVNKSLFIMRRITSYHSKKKSKLKPSICFKNVSDEETSEYDKTNTLKFNDASLVFGHKTTVELLRSLFVLHACSFDSLVNKSHDLMKSIERAFGSRVLSVIVSPFYKQFVAGNSEKSITKVKEKLSSVGINLMIAPMLETDVGEQLNESELFEKNFQKTLFLIDVSSRNRPLSDCRPICQTKITAHISANCLLRISTKYESLSELDKKESIKELNFAMEKLNSGNGSPKFKCIHIADEDLKKIQDSLVRLRKIGKSCSEKNVILAVDAEYSYVNPAINLITLALMLTFNRDQTVIWNTYQGYLKNSKYWLEHDYNLAKSLGIKFGAKIVRGAYMEKERANAILRGTPDPVHDTYESTSASYNSLLDFITPIVARNPMSCQAVVATHNEYSVVHSTQLMKKYDIASKGTSFIFAQIYGMAENISIPLAKHGYNVYKSVPFGSISETLPYLSRRANENRVVFKGARQERTLLVKEIRNRLRF